MREKLYFKSKSGIQIMTEQKYEKEDELQTIIAKHPELILHELGCGSSDLFLISREFPVQDEQDGGNRFFLDHLFVDNTGIPVLVEVKRSSDIRSKREVVAQMIDYACRASKWNIESLKSGFIKNNPSQCKYFNDDKFWNDIKQNLIVGKMILVFVADKIHNDLSTMISFLDKSFDSIMVCGIEVKRYSVNGDMLISTRYIGNEKSKAEKAKRMSFKWDFSSIKDRFSSINQSDADSAMELIQFAEELAPIQCRYGRGGKIATFAATLNHKYLFNISDWGDNIQIDVSWKGLSEETGLDGEEIKERIKSVFDGQNIVSFGSRYANFRINSLNDKDTMGRFQSFCQRILDKYAKKQSAQEN